MNGSNASTSSIPKKPDKIYPLVFEVIIFQKYVGGVKLKNDGGGEDGLVLFFPIKSSKIKKVSICPFLIDIEAMKRANPALFPESINSLLKSMNDCEQPKISIKVILPPIPSLMINNGWHMSASMVDSNVIQLAKSSLNISYIDFLLQYFDVDNATEEKIDHLDDIIRNMIIPTFEMHVQENLG